MPSINVQLFDGRPVEIKRELAQALTKEACRVLGCTPDAVDVVFTDVKREDWATAGVLWSDKYIRPMKKAATGPLFFISFSTLTALQT